MSLVTELEKMILNPSSFVKGNEVNLSGNGRDSCNVFIILELKRTKEKTKINEDDSFYFHLGGIYD